MNSQEIITETEKYVMNTYGRFPIAFIRGEGCWLWDADGKKYLDFLAGIAVNGLGHSHPAIVEVVSRQAAKLIHTSNLFYVQPQAELAEILCKNSFADKVFFGNSGAEANEAAVKLARIYGKSKNGEGCFEVITMDKSFHGRTLAMIAATGQAKVKKGFEPMPEGFRQVPYGDMEAMREAVTAKTIAIMVEPVLGEGGVLYPSDTFLKGLRKLCDEKNILLIFDEIQSGLGRTGKLFAHEHSGIIPDIMTLAKSLGTGIPIGACLATDEVAKAFTPGSHASTFGGNFLVCEAAKKFLEILLSDGFLDHVNQVGNYFLTKLNQLKDEFPLITEVRGKGLMVGVDLSVPGGPLVKEALGKGLVMNCTQEKTLRFLPPLIVTEKEVDEAIVILREVLQQAG